MRWRAVTPEPFETMLVFVELPLLQRALEEVFGTDATHARLRDASAFDDEALNSLLGLLRETKMGVVDVALEVGYANPAKIPRPWHKNSTQ